MSVATAYLSYRQTDRRIKDGHLFTVYLLASAVAVFAVGTISLFASSDPARRDRKVAQLHPVLGGDRYGACQ